MKKIHYGKNDENEIVFSLVMATYNRKLEVEQFILSLLMQSFNLDKVELIVVDQNKQGFLEDIVNKYNKLLRIKHINSKVLGSSINRNIGIKVAKGKIIAFPDDDCTFYNDTLSEVYKVLSEKPDITTVLGQIFDKKTGEKIIRKWPDDAKNITEINFFYLYSCITVFTTNKDVFFDTHLGPNTKFGAYEDADYILSLVKKKRKAAYYFPHIKVNHPPLDINTMDMNKLINYGLGFGAFCKKNLSIGIAILYIEVMAYHSLMLLISILLCNFSETKKRYYSIVSRLRGFLIFSNRLKKGKQ